MEIHQCLREGARCIVLPVTEKKKSTDGDGDEERRESAKLDDLLLVVKEKLLDRRQPFGEFILL